MEKWEWEETRGGQVDFTYPLNERFDIAVSQPSGSNCYVWQVSSCDEVILSTDRLGDGGRFESFTETLVSLVSYLADSCLDSGLVTEEELARIPSVPVGMDPGMLNAIFVARNMLMVDNMYASIYLNAWYADILKRIFR